MEIFRRRDNATRPYAGWPQCKRHDLDSYIGVGISTVVLFNSAVWTIFTIAAFVTPSLTPALTLDVTANQWWLSVVTDIWH
jgi:hypothetical protein